MEWILGSESVDRAGTTAVPGGRGHAVDTENGETACGRPVRSLQVWVDIPWRRIGMLGLDRCPACDAATGDD